YAQIAWPQLVQSADLLGPEVTTLVAYAHAGLLAWCARLFMRGDERSFVARILSPPPAVIAAAGLCIANLAYGAWAMAHWTRVAAAAPRIEVALVQANPEEPDGVEALRTLTESTCASTAGPPGIVCWPESSGGCYDDRLESFADPDEVARLVREPTACLRPLDNPPCPILFGGKFYRGHPDRPRALYQSGILVDATHAIIGRYHKRHLMPFGEYVPGEDWYPDLKRLFPTQDTLTEGGAPTVMSLGGDARIGTMLCYEDMISTAARSMVAHGATVLVSLINGSAFTEPLTLTQHRLLAQLRAVETRRCLVRCAATGETCIIMPSGTIAESLPLHDRGVLRADVPLLEGRTLYSRTGRILPAVCALAVGVIVWRRCIATSC
ncbi:MAG: apolipoprotein N-acyltransferase, partial [Pirellulales bacterium]